MGRCRSKARLHLKRADAGPEAGGSGKERVCLSGACRALGWDRSEFWGLGRKKAERQGSHCRSFH